MKSLISGSEGRTLPPTPCFHASPLNQLVFVESGKIIPEESPIKYSIPVLTLEPNSHIQLFFKHSPLFLML